MAHLWAWARILQQADGPDEVHTAALGKLQIRNRTSSDYE